MHVPVVLWDKEGMGRGRDGETERVMATLISLGFKFDLRLYVAVTSYDPIRIYMYSEGLGRFAAEPYSKDEENLTNLYMHLTNYSINKTHPNFIM